MHVAKAAGKVALMLSGWYIKTPKNDSTQTGAQWLADLRNGHPDRFRDVFGLNKHIFTVLLRELQQRSGLSDSKHLNADEKLSIFLYICTTGLSIRKAADSLQRSIDTISKYVNYYLTIYPSLF